MVMAPASCESAFETDYVSEPDLDDAFFITNKFRRRHKHEKKHFRKCEG